MLPPRSNGSRKIPPSWAWVIWNSNERSRRAAPDRSAWVLEDRAESSFYSVEIQLGPTDDPHLIRVVERWATERKRRPRHRCFAVLVAEEIAPRYQNVLRLISRGVPLIAIQMRKAEAGGAASLRFTPVALR